MITLVQTKNKQGEINPLVKEGVDKNGKPYVMAALYEEAHTKVRTQIGTVATQTQKRLAWVMSDTIQNLAIALLNTSDVSKLKPGAEVKQGRLVRMLSFEPFSTNQEPVKNTQTNEYATINGRNYYSQFTWDFDCSMPDTSWKGEMPNVQAGATNANKPQPELIDSEQFA